MPENGRLLVISEKGIGDALTLVPCLRAIALTRPRPEVTFMAGALLPLKANLADCCTVIDEGDAAALEPLARIAWLRGRGFARVWNTQNAGAWGETIARAGDPRWVSAPPHRRWPQRHVVGLRVEQARALFPVLGAPAEPSLALTNEQREERDAFRGRFPPHCRLIATQPGGNEPSKVWPAAKFRVMIRRLVLDPANRVVLFIAPGAEDAAFLPPELLPHERIIYVREPLGRAVAQLAACDIFAGNDSGFYHLAFFLGLPVVGIYRSLRSVKKWAYRSPRARAVYFYLPSFVRQHWKRLVAVSQVEAAIRDLYPAIRPVHA